jgi:leucyl/phenylalanyl-tRNA--protein transferase
VSSIPAILTQRLWFPDPRLALKHDDDGLLAVLGDLSVDRLLLAYRSGIFPWSVDPITWWSPDPRGIIEMTHFHTPRSLVRTLRKNVFEVTRNKAFRQVMNGCAKQDRSGTWIGLEFIEAYMRLHEAGHAHSVECWQNGELVGGIYGVTVGGLFAGESMFHSVSDASKVALHHLVQHLLQREFALFDIQMVTPITRQLGAVEISREEYLKRLAGAVKLRCVF